MARLLAQSLPWGIIKVSPALIMLPRIPLTWRSRPTSVSNFFAIRRFFLLVFVFVRKFVIFTPYSDVLCLTGYLDDKFLPPQNPFFLKSFKSTLLRKSFTDIFQQILQNIKYCNIFIEVIIRNNKLKSFVLLIEFIKCLIY